MDFQPISEIYQDVSNAIRSGDPRLARIDVSRPNFLARDDLLLVALPLPQILLEVEAVPEEEIASSRLSLEEEIDKFHFGEEKDSGVPLVTISNAEGEANRHSGVRTPVLVIAPPDSSSEEEEDNMALNKGNKSLRELMASRGKVSTSKEATKSQVPSNLPPPPQIPTDLGLKPIANLKKKRPIEAFEEGEVGPQKGTKQQKWSKMLGTRGPNPWTAKKN